MQADQSPEGLRLVNLSSELRDFADTAALLKNLDLIVTVDTAVAHLAGAMDETVWLLLPFAPDFRWLLGRETPLGIQRCDCSAADKAERLDRCHYTASSKPLYSVSP